MKGLSVESHPVLTRNEESCQLCLHPFGPHVVFALGETVFAGGVAVCNVPGCDCVTTWALRRQPRPPMPDPETLSRMREFAQRGHG